MKRWLKKILLPKNKLIILNFHQVSEGFDPAYNHPYIWSSFNFFKEQLDYLVHNHGVSKLSDAIAELRAGTLQGTRICLTFDDGDKTMKDCVVPYLTEKRIPATFFLNSAYPQERKGYWFNEYQYAKNKATRSLTSQIHTAVQQVRLTDDPNEYASLIDQLSVLETFIEEENPFYCLKAFWNDIDETLFEIGLHGHQHLRFSMLDHQQKMENILKNKEFLQDLPCYKPYFALPHGQPEDWDIESLELSRKEGLICFLAKGGYNTNFNDGVLMRFSVDNVPLNQLFQRFSPFPSVYRKNNGLI
ncbi:MAG: polysaccharide deacetylase family protein [Vicingaceae bacterium]